MKIFFEKISIFVVSLSVVALVACGDDGSSASDDLGNATVISSSSEFFAVSSAVTLWSSSDASLSSVALSSDSPLSSAVEYSSAENLLDTSKADTGIVVGPVDTSATDTGNVQLPPDTSSADTATTPSEFTYKALTPEELAQDLEYVKNSAITDFVDIKTVYESLEPDDKVAFVIRHGKRESGTGVESQLTEAGVEQAQRLGSYLASDEAFAYGHTDFVRTRATAQNIAIGRGETGEFKSIVIPQLVASIYIKDQNLFDQYRADSTVRSNEGQVYSKWAFDGSFLDAFNDLNTCVVQSITQVVIPNMSKEHRVNIFVSHDMFLMPIMIYVSQRNISRLQYHVSGMGVYNLEGFAVVVKSNGDRKYYVVNGIKFGS